MRSLAKHLTPDEQRILWILTAVVLLGIAGRIHLAGRPAADRAGDPQGTTAPTQAR